MLQQLINSIRVAGGRRDAAVPLKTTPDMPDAAGDDGFLPNFCGGEMIVNVVVLAQFLAVVFTILTPPLTDGIFYDLFLVSMFLQWIALTSVSVLCIARQRLNRLPERRAILAAYLLLICVTWLVGEFALWLLAVSGHISTARPEWYGYFQVQNLTVSAIINALALRYFVARHQLRQRTLTAERARAEILRQRIRPHFLFNSMNIIASLMHRAPVRAEGAIEDMADLFRLMLDDKKDLMPVHGEIQIAKKYLKLEKLRLDKRLHVNWSIGRIPRPAKTPVLMLQLLLENAIHHGIEQLPEGGDIDISIRVENNELEVVVRNPVTDTAYQEGLELDGTLDNIKLRLKDHFGANAHFSTHRESGNFETRIRHPVNMEE